MIFASKDWIVCAFMVQGYEMFVIMLVKKSK